MLNPMQLKYFIQVVQSGSLNKAAKDLYISQPALTKQLTQLEKQVGHVLFLRKQKGIEVTEAGRFLYDKALFIINQLEKLDRELEGFTKKKFLKIGALPSLATYYLPSKLKNYEEKGYEVTVVVRDTSQELIDMLKQEEINVGYIQDAANFNFDLPMKSLFPEKYWALLPKDHMLAALDAIPFEELLKYKMVLYKDPCDIRTSFRTACSLIGKQPIMGIELEFNDSLLSFVAQNHGISIVPEMAAKAIQNPQLIVKPIISVEPFMRTVDRVALDNKWLSLN